MGCPTTYSGSFRLKLTFTERLDHRKGTYGRQQRSIWPSKNAKATDLTAVAQDYLKLIWSAREWSDEAVTVGLVAERLGVSASTASEGIRKYTAQGLLTHARYGGVGLTPTGGEEYALEMVRRHRLLETFLVENLGYRWDEVHHEAEVLEHAVSDRFIARIDALLGHPRHDPHGDPIPLPGEHLDRSDAVPLSAVQPGGDAVIIRRVSDESARCSATSPDMASPRHATHRR